MKAMVVSPVGGRVPPNRGVLHNGLNLNGTRRDLEALEVAAYLTKLKSLVPDMPRKRKLSKLEVIQRVIEYICDLQTTLEETNVHQETTKTKSTSTRQPLQPLLNTVTTGSSSSSTGSTTPAAAAATAATAAAAAAAAAAATAAAAAAVASVTTMTMNSSTVAER